MKRKLFYLATLLFVCAMAQAQTDGTDKTLSWSADNGNGTFTNPLFYDEFSDPDLIRVGNDFYLAGTTMHSMPGLVVLHSKDLVNWEFLSYCFDRLDFGDAFDLKNGKEMYGQGIWAPCIRYHNGKFYIFSNVNGVGMQVFIATNPAGPWEHINMGGNIYDLSVLFDDDGKIYAVHQYNEVKMVELKPDFSGIVEGSERVIIPAGNAMGEGHHIYKINGKYYIISANFSPTGRMQCARADAPYGPYETVTISCEETMGINRASTVANVGIGTRLPEPGFEYRINRVDDDNNYMAAVPLHQGGIVDLPNGEWWGFSMTDFMSVGRTTCLSPVTWVEGWPYFGLPKNLGRTPKTWFKPNVDAGETPHAPYRRSDDFNGKSLLPVWQWNHNPDNSKWSLNTKKGVLRLRAMAADNFLWARNSLTQRCIGPVSTTTVTLDATALKDGDIAGLAILNTPYALTGIAREGKKYVLRHYDQLSNKQTELPLGKGRIFLCITGDYDNGKAQFSYSDNGIDYIEIGDIVELPYQLKTFQGARMALFAYNKRGKEGGYAEFDNFVVDEPMADRSRNLPIGKVITLTNLANGERAWANPHGMLHSVGAYSNEYNGDGCKFRVLDRGNGRIALEPLNGTGIVTVVGQGLSSDVRLCKKESEGSLFLWQDMLYNQCMLLSLKTERNLGIHAGTGAPYSALSPGSEPIRKNGSVFQWQVVE